MGAAEEPMADEAFWEIVEEAKRTAAERESRDIALRECLEARSPAEVSAFDSAYHEKVKLAYRWDLWGAAYVIGGGCSDDGFRYFCDFLISEGRAVYERALADPDSLADSADASEVELESYGYAAMEAYESVTGSELPPGRPSAAREPAGDNWEEEDLGRLFPRLAAKYDWDT